MSETHSEANGANDRAPSGRLALMAITIFVGVISFTCGWFLRGRSSQLPQDVRPAVVVPQPVSSRQEAPRMPAALPQIDTSIFALDKIPDDDARSRQATELARKHAQSGSLREAICDALARPPSQSRDELLAELVACWPEHDASELLSILIATPPHSVPSAAIAKAANLLARATPEKAAARIASLPPSTTKDIAAAAFASAWAESAPAAAFAWAQALPTGTARAMALTEAALLWAKKNPAQAGAMVLSNHSQHESAESAMVVASVASAMGATNPEQAASWAALLPHGASRNAALSIAAIALTEINPMRAVQTASTIPEPTARLTAIENIMADWPQNQRHTRTVALDRLLQFEPDPSTRQALLRLATEASVR